MIASSLAGTGSAICCNLAVTGVLTAEWAVITMRRIGVIVGLGALLSMLGGVVTAAPAENLHGVPGRAVRADGGGPGTGRIG